MKVGKGRKNMSVFIPKIKIVNITCLNYIVMEFGFNLPSNVPTSRNNMPSRFCLGMTLLY